MELQKFPGLGEAEDARLGVLASYRVMDTPSDPDLEDLVRLAASLCQAPIATITFLDRERQWFKASVGLSISETPRDFSFCQHTVQLRTELLVEDASLDPRFQDNPLVSGEPFARFYAGFPLFAPEGDVVGTLALMDRVPRQLGPFHLETMRVLRRQVEKWLELRRALFRLELSGAQLSDTRHSLERAREDLQQRESNQAEALEESIARQSKAEGMYRALWENTSDSIVISDIEGRIRFASPSIQTLLQYAPDELIGLPMALIQPERYRALHQAGMDRYRETGVRKLNWRSTEIQALRRDQVEVPVEINFSEFEQDGQRLFVGFIRDITERKETERALFEQKEQAQATLRSIADGVLVVDEAGRISYMNPLAEKLTGWDAADALGRGHEEVLDLRDGSGSPPFGLGSLPDAPDAPLTLAGAELRMTPRAGGPLYVEGSITRLNDRQGRRAGSVIAFRDVSQRRGMEAQLTHQAVHDSLTGLVNRGEFERRLEGITGRGESGMMHSLLYLDLDQFKVVNDTCGHAAGDELLRQVAGVIRLGLRAGDTLARLGGDEFGVLLEDCPPVRAASIAEKLREAVAELPFTWGDRAFGVSVSIGRVQFGDSSMTHADVLSKADEACYMAKDFGRNRVHTYLPGDADLAKRHGEMEWVGLIRQALREDNFVLYSQEVFDLNQPAPHPHQEILLRMRGEHGELVPPMAFIPAAERYNLMPAIDRWVIATVIARLSERFCANPDDADGCYAINLSGASVTDAHLPGFIREQLQQHGLPAQCLCFEITETAAIANLANAVEFMNDLKSLGCRFSLDDFGSGMSSFSYLKQLPVDFLKIDGVFVRDIVRDPIDRAMVSAIHEIGHLMGLKTVAEFVEDDAILTQLRMIGVDYGQGYGLARPVPF